MAADLEKSLIQEIVTLHGEIAGYLKLSIEKAIRIGELLTEQKTCLKHGEFLPWIKINVPFKERTARYYMEFWRNRDALKTASIADLNSARELLVETRCSEYRHNRILSEPPKEEETFVVQGDIEIQIRRGLKNRLVAESEKINKSIETLGKLRDEVVLFIKDSATCDLDIATIKRIEEMGEKADKVQLCNNFRWGIASELKKILKDPSFLFPCKRILAIPIQELNDIPLWTCGIHKNCWDGWGWEAGPPETHVMREKKHEPNAPGKCDICEQEYLKLFVMTSNGDLVCPACYLEICKKASLKREEEILTAFPVEASCQ